MPLTLYRRHQKGCEAGFAVDHRTCEFEERKKGYKRCGCFIFASGALAKIYRRKYTGCIDWETARGVSQEWERAGSWDGPKPEPPQPRVEPVEQDRTAILDATDAFLAKCKNRGVQPTTYAKYQTFVNQLRTYCTSRGYVLVGQLTVSDMDRFYASWKDGIRAKAKKLDRLKSFVKFCMKREWLTKDIASDLESPEGSSVTVPKSPFTDEELARIYAACDALGQAPGAPRRNWSGEDAKDFILLSIYTGLRISDVATFDISKRLNGNNVFLRMHKTRRPLFTWIPDWLVARLRARQEKNGALIFRAGVTLNMKQLTDIWRNKRLKKVFSLSGPWEETPHPHRCRHTFVRILLEKGVPVADVAELIGDTEAILRRHYSKWLPGRQQRLTNILQEAFQDSLRPPMAGAPAS